MLQQQELHELHGRVQKHAILLQALIAKDVAMEAAEERAQLRFIVSLHPIPPDVAV